MPSLNMNGPYVFTSEEIDKQITRTQAGNYALGHIDKGFVVKYVGRSDTNVNDRLKKHLSEPYTHFKFSYATSPKDAFEKECKNYHDFGGDEGKLDNEIHPDIPSNSKHWKCPICDPE